MARDYLTPTKAPQYRSPSVRSDYDRYRQPPAKQINAHPSNAIYAPGTGAGTGTAAKKIGWLNRDGSRSPVSGLGGPTGPLSQPMPTMKRKSADAMLADRNENFKRAVADGTATDKINAFNNANADKHMDAGGNIIPKTGSPGYDVPTSGGGYLDSRAAPPAPSAPANTAGQAESMRAAAGITGPSSSARGEWQQGQPGTSKIVSSYGTGSATSRSAPNAPAVASAIGSVNSGSGIMDKLGNGMKAMSDFTKPQAPTFEGKSRESFFADAAQRQGTQNGYAKAPAATPPASAPSKLNHSPADLAKGKEWVSKVEASKAAASNPMVSGKLPSSPIAPSPFSKPAPTPTPAPSTAAAPPPGMPNRPAPAAPGPSAQDIAAQREKAAASQRGFIGNAAKTVSEGAAKIAGGIADKAGATVKAVPEIASRMADGAKKGFTQIGKDLMGHSDETPETRKLAEMEKSADAAQQPTSRTTSVGTGSIAPEVAPMARPSVPMSTKPSDWRSSARTTYQSNSPFVSGKLPSGTPPSSGSPQTADSGANADKPIIVSPESAGSEPGPEPEPKPKKEEDAAE